MNFDQLGSPQQLLHLLQSRVFTANVDWSQNHWRENVQLSPAIAVAQVLEQHSQLLVVLPGGEEIQQLYRDLQALDIEALIFPHWGSSLYKGIRSQNRLFTERSSILTRILEDECGPVLCSLRSLAEVLPPPAEFAQNILRLKTGSELQPNTLAQILSSYGYYQVPRVSLPGEFALRGEVVDFYPPKAYSEHEDAAVRVMFGFDEIERMKIFDTGSQISQRDISEFPLFPLKEVLWQEPQQAALRRHLEELLLAEWGEPGGKEAWFDEQSAEIEELLGLLASQQEMKAEELLFPFAWEQPARLTDYMPDCAVLFWGYGRIEQQEASYLLELETLYEQSLAPFAQTEPTTPEGTGASRGETALFPELIQRRLLHPKRFAVDLNALRSRCARPIVVAEFEGQPWPLEFTGTLQYHGNLNRFGDDLAALLKQGYHVAIGCSSSAQAGRLRHALENSSAQENDPADMPAAGGVSFFPAELSRGVIFPQQKLALLQEWEILGSHGTSYGRPGGKRSEKADRIAKRLSQSEVISSFVELKEGDFVVHVQHGVGRFTGIERISTSRMERDYLSLAYADGNTLFVPIEQVNMVQRYIGSGGGEPKLDRIGGKAWQERKAKTQKAVEDLADRLLRLYTRRASTDGFGYAKDDELVEEFEADFPYEPTKDQLRAVEEIKEDLESKRPMDRLLCGDVGFGKTEVAMRACFKVASQGRQVLLLCPTTILAEQQSRTTC
ncbi:MAG: CarD family transcriptional regulator, partial [Spirochaetota bacterium]